MALSGLGLWWEGRATATTAPLLGATPATSQAATQRNLSPLHFEENVGQLEDQVNFLARGSGYGLYLTRDGATLVLKRGPVEEQQAVSMRLVGARAVEPTGEAPLAARSNYFVGSDPSKWRSGVPSFARVRYRELLPGIDVVYYGDQRGELEYDIVVRSGADPQKLEVELDGLKSLELDGNGEALLGLADGSVLHKHRPVAYQLDGRGARRSVPARFRRVSATRLGLEVGAYDKTRELVLDPTLSYASYLGGSRFDEFAAVAANSAGETYAVGYTTGTLFPTHSPVQATYGGGASDAVICKINAAGTGFVYSTYWGGSDTDRAYGVALDAAGSAYVVGITYSSNFPTASALQPTLGGGQDGFVAKLSSAGALIYSTYLGGSADDLAQGVAVRSNGEAYVVGTTFSANFPKATPLQSALSGTNDAFVSRLTVAGSSLTYSTFLGGSGAEYGQAIALDSAGSAYVVGQTGSSNFPTLAAAQAAFGGAVSDAFVSKLNPAGSALAFSTYLGGASTDVATGVAQLGGSAIVVGYTSSTNFPTANAAQPTLAGSSDAFVTRVGGSAFDFSTYLGGTGADSASAVVADANGFVYVTGQTASSDFPVELPIAGQASLRGTSDAFLAGFSPGATKLYASYLGGNAADVGVGVAASSPLLHVLGNTFSTDFPTTVGSMQPSQPGPQDGFIASLPLIALTPAPSTQPLTLLLLATLLFGAGLTAESLRRRAA